ncbi:MAG TPA: TonB family protein [Caldithrix abyssi]|uniref:TonB family protein n=1 Tax=Caldithrix abyssi TaxID=187145 RepID=A0A7V1LPH1_CALAY|nr:TonB family protein [Caldithrix abyssi]
MRIVYFFILFFTGFSLAQQITLTGTEITTSTVWRGTILIEGDVVVGPNAILTVEAGTRVYFRPNMDKMRGGADKTRSELLVKGVLIVKGTQDKLVLFSSATQEPHMGDWYGIRLINPRESSIINYARIEYAYNGINIKKSSPQISHCQIQLNYNAGMTIEVKARPKINNSIISENGYAGVITSLGARPVFSKTIISLNQIGIISFSLSQPNLGDLSTGSRDAVGQNELFANEEYDLYNHTNLEIKAENNTWGVDDPQAVADHIYDREDDARYGKVDYIPILGQQLQNRAELIQLTQAVTEPPPQAALPELPAQEEGQQQTAPETGATDQQSVAEQQTDLLAGQENPSQALEQPPPASQPKREVRGRDVAKKVEKPKPQDDGIDYDQVFMELLLDAKKSEIISKVRPDLSGYNVLRSKGRVIVRAVVGKDGRVESASVVRSLNPVLDRLAREAAQKFRYKVGTVKGRPVRFVTNILFRF